MSESLVIELRGLADGAVERSWHLPADTSLWANSGLSLAAGPHVSVRARAGAGGGIHVQGELDARLRLICRRCLTDRVERFRVPLDFVLEPGLEPAAADEGVFPLRREGEVADIGPIIREELLLAIPEFPLCRPDCAGLCPQCGVDWNDQTCDCQPSELDPRWDALRKLRV